MDEEIRQLKHTIDMTKNNEGSWFTQVLDRFGSEIISIFASPVREFASPVSRVLDTVVRTVSSIFTKN